MIKKFELHMEKEDISKHLVPFCIDKYNILLKWAETKTTVKGNPLYKIIFEHINGKWDIILVVPGNSFNESNRIIIDILTKEYKKKAKEYKIKIKRVNYSGGHSTMDNQFIQYDLNEDEIKTNE